MQNIEKFYTEENSQFLKNNPTWGHGSAKSNANKIYTLLVRNGLIQNGLWSIKRERERERVTLCDIGCGTGHVLNNLYDLLPNTTFFTGYDIASDAIKIAKESEKGRLQYFCQDIFETDDSFDVLLNLSVLEHIPKHYEFLEKCRKRAEYKIFMIPLGMSVVSVILNRPKFEFEQAGHIHFFNEFMALQTLRNCGYEIIDYNYNIGLGIRETLLLPHASWKRKLMSIPRSILGKISPSLMLRYLGGGGLLILAK